MEKYGAPDLKKQQEEELKGVEGQLSSLTDKLEKTASEKQTEDELKLRAQELKEQLTSE
jgi:Skp family chaperone for outer membrane proteins